tara:strand:- start:2121 stop:2879 length:759 start_codon:yes stop_codon:yes gene_type:complete
MKDLLILYPHGLGDCILLTPAIREFYKATGNKVHIATLERFKSAKLFDNNPYVDKIFYTKDAWHDYPNSQVGFSELYKEWKLFAQQNDFGGIVMPMHAHPVQKIELNFKYLGVRNPKEYGVEVYTKPSDKKLAEKIIKNILDDKPFGFIQTNTGVKQKDLPSGYGKNYLKRYKNIEYFIEVGKDFNALDFNINVQIEIMRKAAAVCLPDSVFYHACHAIKKPIDFVYFGRGENVYNRVKHLVASEENVVFHI